MLHYLYLDYGGRAQYRRELKYSLISLRQELGEGSDARIVVYTDAPQTYAVWPVAVVNIAPHMNDWSRGGLYPHRIKPAVVLDALKRYAAPVCFLDSDSIVKPGFHAEVTDKLAPKEVFATVKCSVVMNRFEKMNPFPPLKGLRTTLPHMGSYHYDLEQSWMFNSGLIGVSPGHEPLLEDTLAFIDALIGRARKFPTIEQFALSEVCRLNQIPVSEVTDSFVHYWQGRRRLYMADRIEKALSPDWNDLTPPLEWDAMNYWAVRAYNYYYGVRHAFAGWKK
ncbi:MAG: hypothetical protein JWN16_2684 [Alphaproteobacteria bacterium]|jgi:hypothetical protein|nr:hypothetical protein [Alphaproteobacteria bacterium]